MSIRTQFTFSPAISFVVHCKDQKELDEYWDKLVAGGRTMPCGWLTDKLGLSWQIVPTILVEWLQHKDAKKTRRVVQAMMTETRLRGTLRPTGSPASQTRPLQSCIRGSSSRTAARRRRHHPIRCPER